MKRYGFVLGLSIVVAGGTWFVLKPRLTSARSNGYPIGMAVEAGMSGTRANDPPPGTPNYGWWQFASFLKSQAQSGVIGPTGFPTPADFDPDWAGPWMNKAQLDLGTPPCGPNRSGPESFHLSGLEYPVQLRIPITSNAQLPAIAQAPLPCQGVRQLVLYNMTASNDIRNQHLDSAAALQALLSTGTNVRFDDHSVIIKELWEPIAPGHTQIPIWRPGNVFFLHPTFPDTYGPISGWQPNIRIDVNATPGPYNPTVSAPVSAFAHMAIGGGPPLAFVLVGINIAHKINGTWYWFAFYWADAPVEQLTGQHFCVASWQQYCMNMTTDPAGATICQNPYLEGQQPEGLKSNCARCHQFAAYPKDEIEGVSVAYGSRPTPIPAPQIQQYMRGAVSTDSLWSLISHLQGQNLQ